MAFPWGAAISAGAGLLGKLFGKDDKPQSPFPTGHQLDDHLRHIVRAAEQNGFNPLTVLGSSAAGVTSGMAAPALSQDSTASDLFGAVSEFFAAYDPKAEERANMQQALMVAQLDNLQADTAARLRVAAAPLAAGPSRQFGGGELASNQTLGAIAKPEVGDVTVTNPHQTLTVHPGALDADAFEQRYGDDVGGVLGGVWTGLRDVSHWLAPVEGPAVWEPKVRELTPEEMKEREESWLPSWVPTFEIQWEK